jgi:O-antigen/teichoic acid export membrane protein
MSTQPSLQPKSPSLTHTASRGAAWALAGNITVSAVSFVGTTILARMLEPKDFGLIGMATVVTGIVGLFGNFGLGAALVQKKDVTHEDLCTAFWANMAAGGALAVVCVLISPLAMVFFKEKAVQWILICLAFNFVISAVASVHSMIIYKRLQMRSLAIRDIGGRVIRVGVMIIAAFCGLRFWSIVIGMIAERIFRTVTYYYLDPWRPTRVFSRQRFNEMFRYGRNLLGSGFLGYLNSNMDFIVTGRVLGADLLGFYQMAYNLPNLVKDYINDSIGAVSFPLFCKVQDDNERLSRGLLRIIRFVALGTFPILAGLAFTARDFIFVAYGEKWLPVVVPLQILCFYVALACSSTATGSIFNAKGRPDLGLKWGLFRLPATVIAILMGVHFGGIAGVAWGMLIVQVISLAMVYQAFQIIKGDLREYWNALYPAAAACIVMIAALIMINRIPAFREISAWVRLIVEFIFGGAVYTLTIVFGFPKTYRDFTGFVKQSIRGANKV